MIIPTINDVFFHHQVMVEGTNIQIPPTSTHQWDTSRVLSGTRAMEVILDHADWELRFTLQLVNGARQHGWSLPLFQDRELQLRMIRSFLVLIYKEVLAGIQSISFGLPFLVTVDREGVVLGERPMRPTEDGWEYHYRSIVVDQSFHRDYWERMTREAYRYSTNTDTPEGRTSLIQCDNGTFKWGHSLTDKTLQLHTNLDGVRCVAWECRGQIIGDDPTCGHHTDSEELNRMSTQDFLNSLRSSFAKFIRTTDRRTFAVAFTRSHLWYLTRWFLEEYRIDVDLKVLTGTRPHYRLRPEDVTAMGLDEMSPHTLVVIGRDSSANIFWLRRVEDGWEGILRRYNTVVHAPDYIPLSTSKYGKEDLWTRFDRLDESTNEQIEQLIVLNRKELENE